MREKLNELWRVFVLASKETPRGMAVQFWALNRPF